MNNHGQLGIGNKFATANPTKIRELEPFEDDYVIDIQGGEHHSIALTKDGVVYCFGKNDEGQIGLGDLYGDWRKKKAEAEAKRLQEEEEKKKQAEQEA